MELARPHGNMIHGGVATSINIRSSIEVQVTRAELRPIP